MRVLVCGGRDYANVDRVYAVLDDIAPSHIIHGGAKGADAIAAMWADERRVPVDAYCAMWDEHGRAAGPLRNQRMLDEGKPDLVVAFLGGRGTADMVRRARAAGVEVRQVEEDA